MLNLGRCLAPDAADGDVPFVPALGDTPCQGFGAKGTGCFAPRHLAAPSVVSEPHTHRKHSSLAPLDAIPEGRGQKMPNMSTVASVVSYQSGEIIDIMINMFINVGPYKFV